MKKRILSSALSVLMAFFMLVPAFSSLAASKHPIYDYYQAAGKHKVSTLTYTVSSNDFTYKVWYPKDIASIGKCPLILYCNGTGSSYEVEPKTEAFLTVAASHGFICMNNSDKNCGTGASMDAGFTELLKLNKTASSPLYKHIDTSKVGMGGHSQGATCTMNLADKKQYKNSKYFKAIFAASLPTNDIAASSAQNCPYNSKNVGIPTCFIAGTGFTDAYVICPINTSLEPNFKNVKADAYMARKKDVEHADSIEESYPYMLAWFDYKLNGNKKAKSVFVGYSPELKSNPDWQDFDFKLYFTKPKLKKLKPGKKYLKVYWEKSAGVKGYQLQYSTDKNFKKNKKTVTVKGAKTVSKKIKKLKSKKKYYVRVRSYRTLDGEKYYSKWSAKMSDKVK